MKKLLLLLTLAPFIAFGQTTLIPDANFEQALINLGLDTGTTDGSVPTGNISGVTGLSIDGKSITDLTGIEDFAALTVLYCGFNQLTSLDVTNNTALEFLVCEENQLTSLDVSNNTALELLLCRNNQLTSLDVSNNTALISLHCENNQLTCLNVKNSNNTNQLVLFAYNNPNLSCIEVDDVGHSNANWLGVYFDFDPQTTFSEDCNNPCSSTTGIPEPPTKTKELLTITDILGRTTLPKPNTLLFYIYEDGSVEKRMQLER